MKKVLFVFGTRPEAIKLAPLVKEIQKYPENFEYKVCITAQHREMLDQVLDFFSINPDYDLDLMKPNQSLTDITKRALGGVSEVIASFKPDLTIVQGDTTTAFTGALAGFYNKSKIVHIEAGLRTGNKFSPYPEEMNRILVGHITDYHFAPTIEAEQNLFKEGIRENVWVVGNTVIDALILGLNIIRERGDKEFIQKFSFIDFSKRIILVTSHRRESFGKPFEDICGALKTIVENNDVELVYPVHLNPNIKVPVNKILGGIKKIHLIEPLNYPELIWLMNNSYLILTDSGGIQEEGPSLGKPILVMRDVTERMEGIEAGTAILVGTNINVIIESANNLLQNEDEYQKMAKASNPYGDGKTSERVVKILLA
ncbi:MAG: UDP-N-acetylglucosamine 2-epimerase (non-hydrolyzing) [Bacteroidales bacterium]|nr:UDP-N-acetylglucosamine 2-epimerase (non-hydrolyzing) [Bacteroidales bacterium]